MHLSTQAISPLRTPTLHPPCASPPPLPYQPPHTNPPTHHERHTVWKCDPTAQRAGMLTEKPHLSSSPRVARGAPLQRRLHGAAASLASQSHPTIRTPRHRATSGFTHVSGNEKDETVRRRIHVRCQMSAAPRCARNLGSFTYGIRGFLVLVRREAVT